MKKTLAMLMALTMTFTLASCGSTDDSSDKSAQTEESTDDIAASEEETEEDTEEDTEEETEEKTEKSTKAKKTTEAETEEETEEATSKKPVKPVKPAASSGITGKWSMPAELLEDMDLDMSGAPEGMEFSNMWLEFTDTDMIIKVVADISGMMYIDDKGLHMYDMTIETLENDGSTLKASMMGKEVATFKRAGSPDKSSIYGEYYAPEDWGSDDDDDDDDDVKFKEFLIEFRGPGETYLNISGTIGKYTFDEAAGKLSIEGKENSVDVAFSGDTMTWTSEKENKTVTFERLD